MGNHMKIMGGAFLTALLLLGGCDSAEINSPGNARASKDKYHFMVKVNWNVVLNADHYRLGRATSPNGDYTIFEEEIKDSYYEDATVDAATAYYYRIVAVGKNGATSLPTEPVQGIAKEKLQMPNGSVSTAEMLGQMLAGLPNFFLQRRLAGRIERKLPEPQVTPPIPGNEEIFAFVKDICQWPHRRAGTAYGNLGEKYIETKFKEFGLENVVREPVPIHVYKPETWKLRAKNQNGVWENIDSFYVNYTGLTDSEGVSGQMIYVGEGTIADYDKLDVRGKIVVAEIPHPSLPLGILRAVFDGFYGFSDPDSIFGLFYSHILTFVRSNFPSQPHSQDEPWADSVYWQAHSRGAAGIVLILRDHPGDTNTHYGPYDAVYKPLPAHYVSSYKGERVRELAQSGAETRLITQGDYSPGVMHNVYGVLPGISKDTIMISTHSDSAFKGATEDGTGVAAVLTQAQAWAAIPRAQRKKTILFVIAAGHLVEGAGARGFALRHKNGLMADVLVNINLEHLAARAVEDVDGVLTPLERLTLTPIFVNDSPLAIAVASRMLKRHPIPGVGILPGNLLGPVPPGESGHYHIHTGVDYIHWIGTPYYLLTAEDTLDKVKIDMLKPSSQAVAEMVATYMEVETK